MQKILLYAAFTVSLIGALGSLFASEILGWLPCELCWYQRIMLYPLVIIFGATILKGISKIEFMVFPLAIIGWLIAGYHSLLQYGIIPERLSPCDITASCLTPYYFWYQFITVPLVSFLTFTAIIIIMVFYIREQHE